MMEVYGFVRFSIQLRELWDTGICTVKFLGFVKAFQQGCHPVIIIKSNRNAIIREHFNSLNEIVVQVGIHFCRSASIHKCPKPFVIQIKISSINLSNSGR